MGEAPFSSLEEMRHISCIHMSISDPHSLELHLTPNIILILGGIREKNNAIFKFSLASDIIIPYTPEKSLKITYPAAGQYSGKFLLSFTAAFKHLGNSQSNKIHFDAQPRD